MKLSAAVIAVAIVAHPFITKAVDGFGQYPDSAAARTACREWREKGENRKCGIWNESNAAQRHYFGWIDGKTERTVTRYYY